MTSTLTTYCSNCGDEIDRYADGLSGRGRCCHNLPQMWNEDGESDVSCYGCPGCGSTQFRCVIVEHREHSFNSADEEEPEYGVLCVSSDYGDAEEVDTYVECRGCGHRVPSDHIYWS